MLKREWLNGRLKRSAPLLGSPLLDRPQFSLFTTDVEVHYLTQLASATIERCRDFVGCISFCSRQFFTFSLQSRFSVPVKILIYYIVLNSGRRRRKRKESDINSQHCNINIIKWILVHDRHCKEDRDPLAKAHSGRSVASPRISCPRLQRPMEEIWDDAALECY